MNSEHERVNSEAKKAVFQASQKSTKTSGNENPRPKAVLRNMGCGSSSKEKVIPESKYSMGAADNNDAPAQTGGELTDLSALQPDKPDFSAKRKQKKASDNELSKYKGAQSTGSAGFVGGQAPKIDDVATASSNYSAGPGKASKATGKEDGIAEAPSPRPNYGD
jgi:hypothetical protein